ncbi:MAG: hypothetical protein JO353_01635, partial [Phycisphaerae bacterium]|nr:hypothetical protein [Phycisphaerae bacterium]
MHAGRRGTCGEKIMRSTPQLEILESRRLLSAAHLHSAAFASVSKHGELIVQGSAHSDEISIHLSHHSLVADLNGHTESFSAKKIHSFLVNAGNGNDTVSISSSVAAPGTVNGGSGDDTINGGGGNETLNGDAGNDTITGGATGTDTENGGNGNDTLVAGNSQDQCDGGSGDDSVQPPSSDASNSSGESHKGTRLIAFSDLPIAVQTTLTSDAAGSTIAGAFKWTDDGVTIFAAFTDSTPRQFFAVDANGNNLPVHLSDHHGDNGSNDTSDDSSGDQTPPAQ